MDSNLAIVASAISSILGKGKIWPSSTCAFSSANFSAMPESAAALSTLFKSAGFSLPSAAILRDYRRIKLLLQLKPAGFFLRSIKLSKQFFLLRSQALRYSYFYLDV